MRNTGRWWGLLFLLFSCSIRDKKQEPIAVPAYAASFSKIQEGASLVKNGDLVVRSGQEFASQLIRQFNRHDKTYSHSGIVYFENGTPFVFHIVTGDEDPEEKLIKDSLERFCNPRKNAGFAIYRYDMSETEIAALKDYMDARIQESVRFDSTFNYNSNDRMYCSEMISKGLMKATGGRIAIGSTQPTIKEAAFFAPHLKVSPEYLFRQRIVAIDNLFTNPHCRLIHRYQFNMQP